MNEDLTFGILGAAMGVAAPHLGDVSGWLSAIGSIGCLIGNIGRVKSPPRKHSAGSIT